MSEVALRARLLAVAGVSALVGTRVYPVILPQNPTFPAITYQRIGGRRESSFAGPIGLAGPLYRLDCWGGAAGTGYAAAKGLANAVRLALDGWKGVVSGITVQACFLDGEPEDIFEDEVGVHRVAMEVRMWWNEA